MLDLTRIKHNSNAQTKSYARDTQAVLWPSQLHVTPVTTNAQHRKNWSKMLDESWL
jgi:hypothetical protein